MPPAATPDPQQRCPGSLWGDPAAAGASLAPLLRCHIAFFLTDFGGGELSAKLLQPVQTQICVRFQQSPRTSAAGAQPEGCPRPPALQELSDSSRVTPSVSQPPSPPAAAPGRALGVLEVPPHPRRTIWGCMSEAQLTASSDRGRGARLRIPRCQCGCWRWERSRNTFSQEIRAEEKVGEGECFREGPEQGKESAGRVSSCSGCPDPVPAAPRGQQLLRQLPRSHSPALWMSRGYQK